MAEECTPQTIAEFANSTKAWQIPWDSCRPGVNAEHEQGVLYLGRWHVHADGFQEHTRRCARALRLTGLPTKLRSPTTLFEIPQALDGRDLLEELKPVLDCKISKYVATVRQMVPTEGALQIAMMMREMNEAAASFMRSRTILYTVWERSRIPEYEIDELAKAGGCWVACKANRDMLLESGKVKNCEVIPVPHFPDDPLLAFRGRKRIPGAPRFYWIGKWEPRKAPHEMMGCFLKAFKPGEAKLFVKTSPSAPDFGDYPRSPEQSVNLWMADHRVYDNGWKFSNVNQHLFIIRQYISEAKLRELHRQGDCYVSLSRGEGFDMPAFDAKVAGNALIYTPSGGPRDFADDNDHIVACVKEVPCHHWYGWGDESRYLGYEEGEAITAMQRMAGIIDGGHVALPIQPGFDAESVGAEMRHSIEELLR